MGKIGSSSIQAGLRNSSSLLRNQRAIFLGTFLPHVHPRLGSAKEFDDFSNLASEEQELVADALLHHVESLTEYETIVISHEALFNLGGRIAPFIERLKRRIELKLVAYLRDPQDWLRSAYAQWGIHHKTYGGPVKSLQEVGGSLLVHYRAIMDWHRLFGDVLEVRAFDKKLDVVQDFASAIGLRINSPKKRVYVTPEFTESLLRAVYNDSVKTPVRPEVFSRTVINSSVIPVVSLRSFAQMIADSSQMADLIAAEKETFEFIEKTFELEGFANTGNSRDGHNAKAPELDLERMLDYLVAIVLKQARANQVLEARVARLEAERNQCPEAPHTSNPSNAGL